MRSLRMFSRNRWCLGIVIGCIYCIYSMNLFKGFKRLNVPEVKLALAAKKIKGHILVTGVAGYLGSHMALNLLEKGVQVLGADNMSRGSSQTLGVLQKFPNFQFEQMDLGDVNEVDKLFQTHQVDTVLHFAAVAFVAESVQNPLLYRHNITQNTILLVDAMLRHNVGTLLFSSTCAVYGIPKQLPITEHTPTEPLSPYGRSKLEAEEYIRSKASANFKAHFLRYFNVIGADSKGRLVENPSPENDKYARMWTACMDVVFGRRQCVHVAHGRTDNISPDGSEIRDYVHVEDVVKANLHLMARNFKENIEVWNVAANQPMSNIEFIETARRVTGVFIPICFVDVSKESTRNSSSPAVIFASAEKLRQETGWSLTYDAIEENLATAWRSTVRHTNTSSFIAGSDMMGIWSSMARPWDWASTPYDVCIVGAGLSSAVLAEQHVTTFNHSVLIVEKRDHIGGNCYDYIDKETSIRVSKYGVHLFHTKYDEVWKYIQRFSQWTPWEHRCVAKVDNKHIPVPVNIDSVNILFNLSITSEMEMKKWLEGIQILPPNLTAVNSEQVGLQRVGRDLYDLIFRPYTIKQWNKDPKDLAPSVLARIPVRTDHDNRYFTDPHQALPTHGYTRIFENMFNSPRITVRLNTDYFHIRNTLKCKHTYFTGPVDAYFSAQGLPKLEYRSLEFERRVYRDTSFYQPMAHVNYPAMSYNYTRAIEYKHIMNQTSPHTVVFFERSTDIGEPYYPVPNPQNQALYAKYQALAGKEANVTFVGRLANYKYFNMDESIMNALQMFDKESKSELRERRMKKRLREVIARVGGDSCVRVAFLVALFPNNNGVGRKMRKSDITVTPLNNTLFGLQQNQSCGFIFTSSNLKLAPKVNGWRTIPLDMDKFLPASKDKSNEAQRLAHYLKAVAPLIFPSANTIIYGDMKCPIKFFFLCAKEQLEQLNASVVTLRHPVHHGKPLIKEFRATVGHMRSRGETQIVFDEILGLQQRYANDGVLKTPVDMPDTMCMAYRQTDATRAFSARWSHTVWSTSMREQLSFNVDVNRSPLDPKQDVFYISSESLLGTS